MRVLRCHGGFGSTEKSSAPERDDPNADDASEECTAKREQRE
jgi:hypothetical protein